MAAEPRTVESPGLPPTAPNQPAVPLYDNLHLPHVWNPVRDADGRPTDRLECRRCGAAYPNHDSCP